MFVCQGAHEKIMVKHKQGFLSELFTADVGRGEKSGSVARRCHWNVEYFKHQNDRRREEFK